MSNEIASFEDKLRRALGPRTPESESAESGQLWVRFSNRLAAMPADDTRDRVQKPPRPWATHPRRWSYMTATAVLTGGAIFVSSIRLTSREPSAVSLAHTYATKAGERAAITLPDGSRATLGPATTLTVHKTLNEFTLTVAGEALFQVQHSASIPFVVRTQQSVTRVLGTTFFVRQYATDLRSRIVVTEGRVAVAAARVQRGTGSQYVLQANTLATVSDSGEVNITRRVSAEALTGWTAGELVFQGTPAREVIDDLSRAYAVEIRIPDSLMARTPINWNVQTTRYTLSQVLPELLMMLNAHAREADSVITIVPGRRATLRTAPIRPSLIQESQYGR